MTRQLLLDAVDEAEAVARADCPSLPEGVGGRVVLSCRVLGNLSVSCTIASETPAGTGFGAAAMSVASSYRSRPTLSDGTSAVGSTARIAVNFQAPQ